MVHKTPEIVEVAQKHHVSPAQATLAWEIARGIIPIPRSAGEEHIRDNFDAQTLELDEEDMYKIKSIKTQKRFCSIPLLRPKW
jgi:2,5-diketo-D-gluconate reductase B